MRLPTAGAFVWQNVVLSAMQLKGNGVRVDVNEVAVSGL